MRADSKADGHLHGHLQGEGAILGSYRDYQARRPLAPLRRPLAHWATSLRLCRTAHHPVPHCVQRACLHPLLASCARSSGSLRTAPKPSLTRGSPSARTMRTLSSATPADCESTDCSVSRFRPQWPRHSSAQATLGVRAVLRTEAQLLSRGGPSLRKRSPPTACDLVRGEQWWAECAHECARSH